MSGHLRKFVFIPIGLAGLSVVFIVICALLRFRGDSAVVLRRKLRIGGMILLLQAVATSGNYAAPSCYEQEVVPYLEPSPEEVGTITMDASRPLTLEATLREGWDTFTFAVVEGDTAVQWGLVQAVDGEIASWDEIVTITIEPDAVITGHEYEIRILRGAYESAEACVETDYWNVIERYHLEVR